MIIFYYLNYILVIVLILKRDITDSQEYPVHIYQIMYIPVGIKHATFYIEGYSPILNLCTHMVLTQLNYVTFNQTYPKSPILK